MSRRHQRRVVAHMRVELPRALLAHRPRPKEAAGDAQKAGGRGGRRGVGVLPYPRFWRPARHPSASMWLTLSCNRLGREPRRVERWSESRLDAAVLVLADHAHAQRREAPKVDQPRDAHFGSSASPRPLEWRDHKRAIESSRHVDAAQQVEELVVPAVVGYVGEIPARTGRAKAAA